MFIKCYKIVDVQSDKFFEFNTRPSRKYKLYKKS